MNKTIFLFAGIFALVLFGCAAPLQQGTPIVSDTQVEENKNLVLADTLNEVEEHQKNKTQNQEAAIIKETEKSQENFNVISDRLPTSQKTVEQDSLLVSNGNSLSDSTVENFLPIPPQTDTLKKKSPEPYIEIQRMVAESFSYAQDLFNEGKVDSAIHFLENFQMLDPLWKNWMVNVHNDIKKYKDFSNQEIEKFKGLSFAIVNEMAVGADYGSVCRLADSLIALFPGDSLRLFAEEKKQLAFHKTYLKVQTEMKKIELMAKQSGDYKKADSLAQRLKMRYRDFVDTLRLDSWNAAFSKIASSQNDNKDFWATNNPQKFLEDAKTLFAKGKIDESLKIFESLLSSPLRNRALEERTRLGMEFCKNSRASAAELYAKALKQKDSKKKQDFIQQAIQKLSNCTEYFQEIPDAFQAETDKKLLLEELSK